MTAQQVKVADDKAAKKAPAPTPKTTEKPEQTGAGAKAITVTVTVLPGSIGGTVGAFATSSVSLPVGGQPALA